MRSFYVSMVYYTTNAIIKFRVILNYTFLGFVTSNDACESGGYLIY